jgi:hypothetical protein
MATTNIDVQSLENILREHLIIEVKKHLHNLIDNKIKDIARDAVINFMQIEIDKNTDMSTMSNNYYFNFVQNITKTVVKPVVVKDK